MSKTIKSSNTILLPIVLALLTCTTPTYAKSQGDYKIDKLNYVYDINADATYSTTTDSVMTVLTESGLSDLNQIDLSYSSSLETVEVVKAYTLKKNGTQIDVPKDNIQDRDVIAGGGPMYSDFKGKVIIFPNLEVGDKIVYTIHSVQKVPMFPKQFSLLSSFSSSVVIDQQQITLSTPLKGLALQTFARGITGGRLSDAKGRARWQWLWQNATVADNEDAIPTDEAPTLQVTSFKDFAALAGAYEARAHAKAAVTPTLQAKADELTTGITAPYDQAKTLYTWVARNIRYAGNCIGVGSVVPHDAEMVLSNRLGDCKDHTALLQALLAAKGIDSMPVLVNSGDRYKLPELPVVEYFNHVINFIPSLNIYADSTADFVPFGTLPYGEEGKMVLPTQHFSAPVQTPTTGWQAYKSEMNQRTVIASDGTLSVEIQDSDSARLAAGRRASFANLNPDDAKDFVRKLFATSGIHATGTISYDDPRQASDTYRYSVSYVADHDLDLPGAGALQIKTAFPSGMSISSWSGLAAFKPVTHGSRCTGSHSIEDYRYEIPKTMKILWLPKDVHAANDVMFYDATYRQTGQLMTVHRELQYRIQPHICSPAEYEAIRPVAAVIAKDNKAQILYQMD